MLIDLKKPLPITYIIRNAEFVSEDEWKLD